MKLIVCASLFIASIYGLSQNDYYVGESRTLVQFSMGWFDPAPRGDIYDFSEFELTFDRDDLEGINVDFNVYRQLNNIISVGGGFTAFSDTATSEFRNFVYDNGDAILQETKLDQFWFGAMAMITPFGAGETFGSRAWAPRAFVPYIIVGAGLMTWEFVQEGDFVDIDTDEIFYDTFLADGATASLRAGAGFRIKLTRSTDIDFSTIYDFAEDDLGGDFDGFGNIELNAQHTSIGLTFRF